MIGTDGRGKRVDGAKGHRHDASDDGPARDRAVAVHGDGRGDVGIRNRRCDVGQDGRDSDGREGLHVGEECGKARAGS